MKPGVWQNYYFSYRFILPSIVIPKAQQTGASRPNSNPVLLISLFLKRPPSPLRINLNKTTFFIVPGSIAMRENWSSILFSHMQSTKHTTTPTRRDLQGIQPLTGSGQFRAQRDRARFWKSTENHAFKFYAQWNRALHQYPVLDRPSRRCASALHSPTKLCILCNCRSPAEPHGPPGLQVRLHYTRIFTKKWRKARRREGDKCFLGWFILHFLFLDGIMMAHDRIV